MSPWALWSKQCSRNQPNARKRSSAAVLQRRKWSGLMEVENLLMMILNESARIYLEKMRSCQKSVILFPIVAEIQPLRW